MFLETRLQVPGAQGQRSRQIHIHEAEHGHGPDVSLSAFDGFERHTLTSVGIDIGSSTSHVVLSRLTIRRKGSELSTQFVVAEREVLYTSAPVLTPYVEGTRIDVDAIEQFVQDSYEAADTKPADVDTGAVVITGEALNKQNAPQIAEMLSRWAGDFICVSAGPHHEGVLAAHGSGSVELSKETAGSVLNVDLGGGTTKVSLIENGTIRHVEAFSVGARLIAFDKDGTVIRVEPPAHEYGAAAGVHVELGAHIDAADVDRIAALMADVVLDSIQPGPGAELRRRLMVSDASVASPQHDHAPERIVFSGGVSEYVYGRDSTSYGDLGPALGAQLRARLDAAGLADRVVSATQGIRATVLGASQFTVQASGQTSYVPDLDILPIRSLPVVRIDLGQDVDAGAALQSALQVRDLDMSEETVAVSISFRGPQTYATLRRHAESLVHQSKGAPLIVVMKDDLARAFGRILAVELGHTGPLAVIDGIDVAELDFLDIGRPLGATHSFPVTVKSLTLPSQPLSPTPQMRN